MSDRDARKLEGTYLDLLRQWLSCISRATLLGIKDNPANTTALRTNPRPLPLRSQSHDRYFLEIHQEFTAVPTNGPRQYHIQPVSYRYELNDAGGKEIFAYHYHPTGLSSEKEPHLHSGILDPRLSHGKKHLPTGYISLAEIVRCLITEFEIPPLRQDWVDILAATPGTIQSGSTI